MKKSKVTIISGTPGTGKSTLAKKLDKKEKAVHIDVNTLIKKEKIFDKYDKKLKTMIVDIRKLITRLEKLIKEYQKKQQDIIIDSHLAHYLNPKLVSRCIITKCNLKTLKRRLEKRGYSKKKVRENLDAEILDVCALEAFVNKQKKIEIVDTSGRKKK